MSERQATLHDERIDLLSAMVVDLRARLAAAEAERDAALEDAAQLRAALDGIYARTVAHARDTLWGDGKP